MIIYVFFTIPLINGYRQINGQNNGQSNGHGHGNGQERYGNG
jgi:hypothetical protein